MDINLVLIVENFICLGFVYGAKDNNRLQLFIDDINLPNPDEYGVRHYNEVSDQCQLTGQ